MSATVSTRWFWPDWMSDPGVRASCLAARGLWKDLLCIAGMNKGSDYGFVMLNGHVPSIPDIARIVGASEQEVTPLLTELEKNGVFSRDRRRAIYCRRMVRAEKNRSNGRLGGNPKLLKENRNQESVGPSPKPLVPEPIPEPELPIGSPGDLRAERAPDDGSDVRTQLFRAGVATLVKITGKNVDAAKRLIGRWLRDSLDDAVAVLRAIEDADRNRVAEPLSWIEAALRHRDGRSTRPRRSMNGFAAIAYESLMEERREEIR